MTVMMQPKTAVPEPAWRAAIAVISCAVLVITTWCLSQGITTIFMHLYYIPIILLAYHYRKKGLFASVLLSLAYLALVWAFEPADIAAIEGAGIRVIIFIGVAALVAYLSERLVQAREALDRKAQVQQGIIENANAWIMVLDRAGRVLEWNAAAEDMSGYPARDVIGKNDVWKTVYPDKVYRREITTRIAAIIREDRYLENFRTTITCRDRTKKTILWNTRILPHEEGETPRYIAVGVDVTSAVNAENELQTANSRLMANEEELREQYEDLTRSQKVIRESEAEYKNILRTAMDGFCIVGPQGAFLDVNDAFCTMTGYTREELLALSLADIEVKETESAIATHIREIIRKGADRFESQYRCRDGSIIDVEVSVVHAETHSRHFVVFVHDITNRKRAEEALKSSDARMRAMLESIIAGVVIIDPDTHTIIDANAVAVRMIGARREAIIGSVCHKYICPAEAGACPITDLGQVVDHSEKLLIHADGTTSPILKSVVPVRLSDRTYLLESFIDISDIKKAQDALRASEEQFRILAEQSSDIICTIGLNESITFISPAIKKILGYDPVDVIGKNAFDFIFHEDRLKGREAFKSQVIEKGQVQVVTVELVRKDGSCVPVEFTLAPVIKAGVLAEVLVSGRDITERKRAEAALKESEDRFRELFNSMTSGVAVYRAVDDGADFVFVDFNHGAEIIDNIQKQEVIGKRVTEAFPGAARFGIIDVFRRVWQTGESENVPVSLYADERITGWRENFVYRLPSGEIVAIFDDVTERKIAEDALRESEERYRTLFVSSQDAIMTIEPPDWRFTSANPATVAMFMARDEAELVSTWPWQVSPERQPDGRLSSEKAKENIEKALKDGSNFFEWTHRRLNGEDFPATVLATRFEWKGQIIVQGTVRDITAQKRAEEALRQSEEKFRDIFDKANDAIEIIELQDDMSPGRYIDVNEVASRMLGYTKEEMLQHGPFDFDLTDYNPRQFEEIAKTLQSQGHMTFETAHRRKDGGIIPVEVNYHIITLLGKRVGLAIVRDITGRKQAEAALAESEEKFRGVAERSSDIIQLTDTTGRITYASPSIKRILGFDPDEVIGTVPDDIVHPDDIKAVHELIRKNMAGPADVEGMETRVRKKGGGYATLEVSVSPVIKDGVLSGMQVMARDITEKKVAEVRINDLLRLQEEQVEIIKTSPAIAFLWKAEENWPVETVSENISRLGYTPDDFISGRVPFGSIIHPDDLGRVAAEVEYNSTHTIDSFSQSYRIFGKDKKEYWIEDFTKIRRDSTGTITHYQGIVLDITDRKLAEMERDRLVSVIQHSGELIGLSTPDRKIMFLNEAGAQMLGTSQAEALGRDFSEFVPDHLKENLQSVLLPALMEHGRWDGDLQYRNMKTGNLVDVHAMTFLINDPVSGAPQFLATVSLDITARKRAETELKKYSENLEDLVDERTKELRDMQEELVKNEKLAVLGKLAGGVGHELRNPLGAIKNAAYFLNMVLEDPEPDVQESLEIMNKEVARSEDILSSLLDFARPTVLTLRKVRINDVLSEAVTRNPIPENITLIHNPDDTLPDIMADPDKLLQVFTNLVTNACQAMPDGGSLTLQSALSGENRVSVSVTDTGVGISEENMKRLFEPLFSTKAKGIGLGLVVTKSIVEAHHGSIDIRSEAGKGTTFTVTLPIGIEGGAVT